MASRSAVLSAVCALGLMCSALSFAQDVTDLGSDPRSGLRAYSGEGRNDDHSRNTLKRPDTALDCYIRPFPGLSGSIVSTRSNRVC